MATEIKENKRWLCNVCYMGMDSNGCDHGFDEQTVNIQVNRQLDSIKMSLTPPMKFMPTQENSWEKTFDEFYTLPENMIPGPQRERAIKAFIASVEQEAEKRGERKGELYALKQALWEIDGLRNYGTPSMLSVEMQKEDEDRDHD